MSYLISTLVIGIGATLAIDLWAIARKRLFGIAAPDYGMVGRWLGHMPAGQFRHQRIAAAAAMPGERLIGWVAHYLIGISFAALLVGIWGEEWVRRPTLAPALIVGIGTVAAPFLIMQPGMGSGIAASRTPNPKAARLQSLTTHTIFGLGLYGTGLIFSLTLKP